MIDGRMTKSRTAPWEDCIFETIKAPPAFSRYTAPMPGVWFTNCYVFLTFCGSRQDKRRTLYRESICSVTHALEIFRSSGTTATDPTIDNVREEDVAMRSSTKREPPTQSPAGQPPILMD